MGRLWSSNRPPTNAPLALPSRSDKPGVVDVRDPLADGNCQLSLVVQKAISRVKDTLKTPVPTRAPQQVQIKLALSVQAGVLRAKHHIALNAIRYLR